MYVVGGFNGSLRVRTVDVYNPSDPYDAWSTAPSMEARRSTLGVAVYKDCIYAVGGFDGSMGLNTAEVLDLSKGVGQGSGGGGARGDQCQEGDNTTLTLAVPTSLTLVFKLVIHI